MQKHIKGRRRFRQRGLGGALGLLFALPIHKAGAESLDLLSAMGALQSYTHKAQLSLDHGNLPLAEFYVAELAGIISQVSEMETYGDYPVGQLAVTALKAPYARLSRSLAERDSAAAVAALDGMIEACNSCHALTEHEYVVIQRNPSNPYLQDFTPR